MQKILKIQNNKVSISGKEYTVEDNIPGVLDIKKAEEFLEGNLKFVGVWFVKDCTGYVFHSESPNRLKKHKDYCIVKYRYNGMSEKYDMVIMGYDTDEMLEMSTQGGVACHNCKTIIWSLYRHDYHYCNCLAKDADRVGSETSLTEEEISEKRKMACSIDGGMDYIRSSPGSHCTYLSINHLTKEITLGKEEEEKGILSPSLLSTGE